VDTADRRAVLLLLASIMGIIAVASGNSALLIWAVSFAALSGAAIAWARVAWKAVDIKAAFKPPRVFSGEPVVLRVKISNRKRFPLPVVHLAVWLPAGLRAAKEFRSATIRGFQRQLYIPGRSEVVLNLPVSARRRGEFWLERVQVTLSDPFDFTPLRRKLGPEAVLLVMPEPRFGIPMSVRRRLPFGAPAPASRMFEARERFAGVRPYEPGDPLNRIHWKLTGHTGGLHTKLFEPTRTADVLLALDLATGEPFWDSIYPELAEDAIGWTTYLARQAIEWGWRVGLVANTHLTRGRGPLRVPPSSAHGQEAALFAALARMPNEATSDLAPILREAGRGMGRNASAVVVSSRPGPWLWHEMAVLRRRGTEVVHLSPLEASLAGAGA
jgi:uncharacterized protein (DUF58 family)